MTKPLLAYSVVENCESTGGIVFARHRIAALKQGACAWSDGDISGMILQRVPWADHCADTGIVPANLMIAHGWHFECHGCGATIDEDWLAEEKLDIDGVVGNQNGPIFCCARCKWRNMRYMARRVRAKSEAVTLFQSIIRQRFGDVEFAGEHVHLIEGERGGFHWYQVHVAFNFPGMVIGPAWLQRDEPSPRGHHGFIGPAKARYTCCAADREAFEKFAAETTI